MKHESHSIWISFFGGCQLGLFASMIAVGGIAGCGPNHRIYSKGYIRADADFVNSKPVYRTLEIGTSETPVDVNMGLVMKLPNGDIVQLEDLRPITIQGLAFAVEDIDKPKSGWPAGTKRFYVGGYNFVIGGEKVLQVGATTVGLDSAIRIRKLPSGWEANVPRFGRTEEKLYELPLSEEDLIALFGRPDSLKDLTHN